MKRILLLLIAFFTIFPIAAKGGYKDIATSSWHHLVLKDDGSLWSWGKNDYGQLGDGTTQDRSTPRKVMDNVKRIFANHDTSYAIKNDGSLWVWGANHGGDLGLGYPDHDPHPKPVQILPGKKFIAVSNKIALTNNGEAWVWNKNYSPYKVLDNVKYISGNSIWDTWAFVLNDGSLWMMGSNIDGVYGDGTTKSSYRKPVKVMTGVKSISLAYNYALAIREDDSLWSWGKNKYGQLGDGTFTDRLTPAKVMNNVKSISANQFRSLAIDKQGRLWGWGFNESGGFGDGSTVNRPSPVKIDNNVVSVCSGMHVMYITTNGDLMITGTQE